MSASFSPAVLVVFLPAIGALMLLLLDLPVRARPRDDQAHRADALAGIRMGSLAALSLVGVWLVLRTVSFETIEASSLGLQLDPLARLGLGFLTAAGLVVLGLALTHFGLAHSRPAEPLTLLLFSISGMAAALAARHLLVVMIALELAWLPLIGLIAIDSRRLSSSESSLKAFFAHALASLLFAHGVAFVFGATGSLDWSALGQLSTTRPLLLEVGISLVLVGLLARSTIAPFHPWSPDVHEGAPSFVTAHIASVAHATTFIVLLRLLHALVPFESGLESTISERVSILLGALGVLGLLWGHAMALVQVGMRRLLGWLGVGQAGFFALALVEARDAGGAALLFALFATAIASAGVLAILSSFSHHERTCEHVGDLSGMLTHNPVRAGLLALFLLSLAGFPGTVGFVARLRILAAVEHGGHRWLLVAGLVATVLAFAAVGRPLLAMLRPVEPGRQTSRALTNEQLVLAVCGACVLYLGFAPVTGEANVARLLVEWIDAAVAGLRG